MADDLDTDQNNAGNYRHIICLIMKSGCEWVLSEKKGSIVTKFPALGCSSSLFHTKITVCVTKSLHQDCGPCYLHFPIFFLINTLSSSAAR